jgi:hypothetical protein
MTGLGLRHPYQHSTFLSPICILHRSLYPNYHLAYEILLDHDVSQSFINIHPWPAISDHVGLRAVPDSCGISTHRCRGVLTSSGFESRALSLSGGSRLE